MIDTILQLPDFVQWIVIAIVILLIFWTFIIQSKVWTGEHIGISKPPNLDIKLSPEAESLHKSLTVADLHADTLIWRRNLLKRNQRGFFDFHRMAEGNVALQGFLSVTEIPKNASGDNLTDKSNKLTTLAIIDQWPIPALISQTEGALYFAKKLKSFCAKSENTIHFVRTSSELKNVLELRKTNPIHRGVTLGLESSDATKYSIKNIEKLFQAGYSTSALCHLIDSKYASSTSGVKKEGLTEDGIGAVQAMDELGMLVDLAHASAKTVTDVLKHSKLVPYISHTGSAAISSDPKCLPDEILKEVVHRGGIVGICFVEDYLGGKTVQHILNTIEHLLNVLGSNGVALGSGFDSFETPIAVNHMSLITRELLNANYDNSIISNVMGDNVIQYFLKALPK